MVISFGFSFHHFGFSFILTSDVLNEAGYCWLLNTC